jgi:glycerol-3-phosphate dehydrogenase
MDLRVEVLIIGGGPTGAGTARDLAMRGFHVLLLESGDFCAGASGGNHGMLHSGARYAVRDPGSAAECASESDTLKRIAPHCIEDTGGLFVRLSGEDAAYVPKFIEGCRSSGVSADALTRKEMLALEPELSPSVEEGFAVRDGSVDPFRLVLSNIDSARAAGAMARNHCPVIAMDMGEGRVRSVRYQDGRNGEMVTVEPEVVINAAGAWADQVAAMAGCRLEMTRDYGAMLVYNGRLVDRLINRLRPPADGDIIVPNHTAMIIGTTSRTVQDPRSVVPMYEEVSSLMAQAEAVVPKMKDCRIVRAYGGARPLAASSAGRGASRSFRMMDHADEGAENLISIIGGKLTTYRLMAAAVADRVGGVLGKRSNCRTAAEPLVIDRLEGSDGLLDHQVRSLRRRYGGLPYGMARSNRAIVPGGPACSCEQVMRFELDHFSTSEDVIDISDLMRRTRAGMGYCQSLDCAWEMMAALIKAGKWDDSLLRRYHAERLKGVRPVLQGDQLRQELFTLHVIDHDGWEGGGE